MGPLASRVNAIEAFINDAQEKGAKVATGGTRIGNQGNFSTRSPRTPRPRPRWQTRWNPAWSPSTTSASRCPRHLLGGSKDSGFGHEGGIEGLQV